MGEARVNFAKTISVLGESTVPLSIVTEMSDKCARSAR